MWGIVAAVAVAVVVVAAVVVAAVMASRSSSSSEDGSLESAGSDADSGMGESGTDEAAGSCPGSGSAVETRPGEDQPDDHRLVRIEPSDDQRWYVNQDPDARKRHGREVTITAYVEPAEAGVNVHFRLVPGDDNREGLGASAQARLSHEVNGTDAEGRAETVLTLSTYGGDEFRVLADLEPIENDRTRGREVTGTLTVWRKLYYEVAEMARPGDGDGRFEMSSATSSAIESAFEGAFIEYIELGSRDRGTYEENFTTHQAWRDWGERYFSDDGKPWKIHYCIVERVVPSDRIEEVTLNEECTAETTTLTGFYGELYRFGGTDWLVSARYENSSGTMVDLPDGAVTATAPSGLTRIRVSFASVEGVTPTRADPVRVEVIVKKAPGFNGWGGGSGTQVAICRGTMERYYRAGQVDTTMSGTGTHEPGHTLGLVYGSLAWKSASHGSHCSHRDCVMWYQGYVGRPVAFHDESVSDPGCRTYLRGKDLSRSAMQSL